jgi:hypothetical protein
MIGYTGNMSKNKILLFTGILIIIIPFSGFPEFWRRIFFVAAGLFLVMISITRHMKRRSELKSTYNG